MKRHRTKLLITLVLFAGVLITAWTATRAEARGFNTSVTSGIVKSGGIIFSGDPDSGAGVAPPPPSSNKGLRKVPVGGQTISDWVHWTSWIWATLLTRAAK